MHGRNREVNVVLNLIRAADWGRGGMVLVEGEPGIGKTRFLRESSDAAVRRGFSLAGNPDQPPVQLPVTVLLAALGLPAPVSTGDRDARPPGQPSPVRVLGTGPGSAWDKALIVVDDVHRADAMVLHRLRSLPSQMRDRPALWLLSRSTGASGEAGQLFGQLEQAGAVRVTLGPLDDAAVAGMMTEELGATPQPDLLGLAAGASGNPLLVTELLGGLQDEDAVRIDAGTASLLPAPLPQRLRAAVRCWVTGLGPQARQFLEVGATLGMSFQLDTAAALLGESPARLLPALRATLEAGILITTRDWLAFHQALVWRAVIEDMPVPALRALHRQAGEFLIEHGAPAAEAAAHLISGSRLCGAQARTLMDDATGRLLPSSPETAAELASSALALTGPADPARVTRTVLAVEALTAAMRLTEAEEVARSALAGPLPLPAIEAARLRGLLSCALLCSGQPSAAAAEAEHVLSGPGLTTRSRTEAGFALLAGHAAAGDPGLALIRAGDLLGAAAIGEAAVGKLLAEAVAAWRAGQFGAALAGARAAARRGSTDQVAASRMLPPIMLAGMLLLLGSLAEAAAVIRTLQADAATLGLAGRWAYPDILRASLALAEGDRRSAVARAEAALRMAQGRGCQLLAPQARSVLATAALRAGDLRTAARQLADSQAQAAGCGHCIGCGQEELAAAQVTEAQEGPRGAAPLVAGMLSLAARDSGALLAAPAGPAWLVRYALGQLDRRCAEEVAGAVRAMASGSPGFAALDAAEAHARGLLEGDPAPLGQAAAGHPDPWARASAAEDQGVLLAGQRDFRQAAESLETALAAYEQADADRDGRRVRRRLRALGIRHRQHAPVPRRPQSGWASLTDTERTVSGLVAEGLTNQQAATEMFLSAHTVAYHLRHIYRKLGIGSRVGLTRILAERGAVAGSSRAS